MGLVDDALDGCVRDRSTLVDDRLANGLRRIVTTQWPDLGEIEQAFCIRLCIPHASTQLWQAGADEHDRHTPLRAAVHGRDQSRQLRLLHVLQFVYEHH